MTDHARPLNARGRAAAAAMGMAMRRLGLVPDVILVSSSRRTLQTLEALSPWQETPLIEPMDGLYLASAAALLEALRGVAETVRSVLLLGHNPGLHELAVQLAAPGGLAPLVRRLGEGFPTGALGEFALIGPWSSLAHGRARLQRFLTPRELVDPGG